MLMSLKNIIHTEWCKHLYEGWIEGNTEILNISLYSTYGEVSTCIPSIVNITNINLSDIFY